MTNLSMELSSIAMEIDMKVNSRVNLGRVLESIAMLIIKRSTAEDGKTATSTAQVSNSI